MVATEIAVATDLTIDTTIETTTTVLYKRVGSKRAGSKLAKISTLIPIISQTSATYTSIAPPMPLSRRLTKSYTQNRLSYPEIGNDSWPMTWF